MPTVDLSWDDNSSIEDGFKVYRSKTENPSFPSDYTEIADLGANTTTYTDTEALFGDLHYAVVATNQTAETDPTKASIDTFTPELSWTDNSSIEDGFKVYRSTTENPSFPSDYTEIADLGADTTTYTDTTAPLTKNYYAVVATNQTAETDPTKTSVAPFAVGLKLNGSDVSSVSVNGTTVSLEDIEIY